MRVLESQLSAKFLAMSQLSAKFWAISQLSVNFDKSQLLLFLFLAELYILVIF